MTQTEFREAVADLLRAEVPADVEVTTEYLPLPAGGRAKISVQPYGHTIRDGDRAGYHLDVSYTVAINVTRELAGNLAEQQARADAVLALADTIMAALKGNKPAGGLYCYEIQVEAPAVQEAEYMDLCFVLTRIFATFSGYEKGAS